MIQNNLNPYTESNQNYVPFEDGIIIESQGYYKIHKCEYCGKPNNNANCHAHESWCPRYCDGGYNELPLGNGIVFLLLLAVVYLVGKYKFNKK